MFNLYINADQCTSPFGTIFVCGHNICSEKRTVLRERNLSKTVNFEEQLMHQTKVIVLIILQILSQFCAMCSDFKTGEYLTHLLGHSHVSK